MMYNAGYSKNFKENVKEAQSLSQLRQITTACVITLSLRLAIKLYNTQDKYTHKVN